jgi:hypothetical protein
MKKSSWSVKLLAGLAVGGLLVAPAAQAREPREIFSKVLVDYKTIPDARKKLRKKLKKGQPLSGDEYYVLAFGCGYESPQSGSMILNALSKSKCKDQVVEYYLEAGRRGTPEGFVAAAKRPEAGADAYFYAQLAYQFAAGDPWISNEALTLLSDLRPKTAGAAQQDARAKSYAAQLVEAGAYPSSANPATNATVAAMGPKLDWLDFANAKTCQFSDAATNVLDGASRFDQKRRSRNTVPASVRVPGIAKPVRGRVVRPDASSPSYVEVYVDFTGRWNGLSVLGMQDAFIEESDGVFGTGIRFREPVGTVASRLAAAGFVVNRDGSTRIQEKRAENVRYTDERGRIRTQRVIDGVVTSIERRGGETVFLCNEVYNWSP